MNDIVVYRHGKEIFSFESDFLPRVGDQINHNDSYFVKEVIFCIRDKKGYGEVLNRVELHVSKYKETLN